ncbi:methyl-accepting chemotaxis protein [Vibrio sp. SCSIO 43137]|uniref:methyl-accepting chemotaxis protein n=1 Tax=Vibrio sp. SCSIO 43137 TaxID=3021011 RepID=UPI0023072AFC|nr:methyl-accepting chemotaxis protein [Vibrio sp. SCSIO 43137]WCE28895.1 methyl-accepting chemotaxis protein [Vibrio sp. SCSIO 43137]
MKLGFKVSLMLSVSLLVAVSVSVVSLVTYLDREKEVKNNAISRAGEFVQRESESIKSFMENKALAVEKVINIYDKNRYGVGEHNISNMILGANTSGVDNLQVTFETGESYASVNFPGWANNQPPKGYSPKNLPWYAEGRRANGVIFTDPYTIQLTGKLSISAIGPITEGVMLADIGLDVIYQVIERASTFEGATAFLVTNDSTILATSSTEMKAGENLSGHVDLANAFSQAVGKDDFSVESRLDGRDSMFFSEQIKFANATWYLVLNVDKEVILASLDETIYSSVITSLILVVLSIAAVFFLLTVLYRPIYALKRTVTDLASGNGDLTQRLEVKTDDDLGCIAKDINTFIANLQSMMLEVSQSSAHIFSSVEELRKQNDKNRQILSVQTSEVDQIVVAIEEMSATVDDVANNASQASQFTHNTNEQVISSRNVVTNTTNTVSQLVSDVENTSGSISAIEKDIAEIANVLTIIGEIAEQTNLLALNAAIEAARAGEQGRGFAVVADEVRALAARTQTSTAEIEATLTNLRNGSESAIQAMSTTQSTCEKTTDNTSQVADELATITTSVTHINDLNTQIATAAEQQSSVAQEITKNVTAIREIVYELSANGEVTTSESVNLAAANSQLKSIVDKFKLS